MLEEWKPLKGYEGSYEISNMGRVRSLKRAVYVPAWKRTKYVAPRILKNTWTDRSGYRVTLTKEGYKESARVARLVAEHFLFPTDIRMADMMVVHKNGDRRDVKAANLAWVNRTTYSPPARPKARYAAAKLRPGQVKEIRRRLRDGWSNARLSRTFKVCPSTISKIKKFKVWKELRV